MASRRIERIASLIRSLLADAIQSRLADPRIPPITSITRVEVSDDLSVAHVHVSVMGRDSERRLCVTALRHAAGRLRRELAPHLHLRQLPRLVFGLDDSLRRSFETVCRIDQAMRELGEVPEWEREEDEAGDEDDRPAAEESRGLADGPTAARPELPPPTGQEDA